MKTRQYRIIKKAEKVYIIKERHTFMFFWRFWSVGSIHMDIPKQFTSAKLAENAIVKACAEHKIKPFIINIDGARMAVRGAFKKMKREQRKKQRKAEEAKRNLRRIGVETE